MKTRNYARKSIFWLILILTLAGCKSKKEIVRINDEASKIEVYKDTRKDTTSIIETTSEEANEEVVISTITIKFDTLQRPLEKRFSTTKKVKVKTTNGKTEVQRSQSDFLDFETKETTETQIRVQTEADPLRWWRGALIFLWLLLFLVFIHIIREIKK